MWNNRISGLLNVNFSESIEGMFDKSSWPHPHFQTVTASTVTVTPASLLTSLSAGTATLRIIDTANADSAKSAFGTLSTAIRTSTVSDTTVLRNGTSTVRCLTNASTDFTKASFGITSTSTHVTAVSDSTVTQLGNNTARYLTNAPTDLIKPSFGIISLSVKATPNSFSTAPSFGAVQDRYTITSASLYSQTSFGTVLAFTGLQPVLVTPIGLYTVPSTNAVVVQYRLSPATVQTNFVQNGALTIGLLGKPISESVQQNYAALSVIRTITPITDAALTASNAVALTCKTAPNSLASATYFGLMQASIPGVYNQLTQYTAVTANTKTHTAVATSTKTHTADATPVIQFDAAVVNTGTDLV